ncbi:unnamed protein product [Sphagnum jensenii]
MPVEFTFQKLLGCRSSLFDRFVVERKTNENEETGIKENQTIAQASNLKLRQDPENENNYVIESIQTMDSPPRQYSTLMGQVAQWTLQKSDKSKCDLVWAENVLKAYGIEDQTVLKPLVNPKPAKDFDFTFLHVLRQDLREMFEQRSGMEYR